jgi:O-antigen ligase
MVGWPWVVLWQGAVLLPVIWVLWQCWSLPGRSLGLGWNLGCGLTLLVLVLSSWQAEFPVQARWYGGAALGAMATLYGLQGWLTAPEQAGQAARFTGLLRLQTLLFLAFTVLSLGLWFSQTYLPELARLQTLAEYGTQREFNFGSLSLRNWYPIGHQNYVAGFLVLNLPVLVGWGWSQGWRWRLAAWGGAGLGLVDLYTTGSRAGGLGLGVAVLTALLLWGIHQRPKRWQWLLMGSMGGLSAIALILTNDRLRTSVTAILQGNLAQGELAYRWITLVTGWRMGVAHPWTGLGLGSVPLAYQRYRPGWAGREAELIHQLHNTPIQLWAELGIGGLGLLAGAIALVAWTAYRAWQRSRVSHVLLVGIVAGLVGYGAVALTDYQLDNIAITGSLLIGLALLIRLAQSPDQGVPASVAPQPLTRRQRRWVMLALGGWAAYTVTLIPMYRAWNIANQGFVALTDNDIASFVEQVERAHQIAPWQPYYPYQLGWKLGDLSLDDSLPAEQRRRLQREAIAWFQQAIAQSPHLEFGYSSLGWLQGDVEPVASAIAFTAAAQLVPAKAGVFFGLAVQFLRLDQPELAIQAFVLETARHPLFLTSPFWQQPGFQRFYPQVLDGVEALYGEWLSDLPSSAPLYFQARRVRGGLRWWRGDWAGAAADWQAINDTLGLALIAEARGTTAEPVGGSGGLALQAWQQPQQRRSLLAQAWTQAPQNNDNLAAAIPPPELLDTLGAEMDRAETFQQWLKSPTLARLNRYERLGFGVLSRYIDGPQPVDYWIRIEHLAMDRFFATLFPSPSFMPELDQRLAPLRSQLIESVEALGKS